MDQAPTTNRHSPPAEDDLRRRLEEAEARLGQSQGALLRYRDLFEFAPDAYVVTDLSGAIEECNQAAVRLFGRPRDFLCGKPLPFFFHRHDRPDFFNRLIQMRGLAQPFQEWEARLEPRPGLVASVGLTVMGYPDAEGRGAGLRWLLRDISARKAGEDALRAEKSLVEGLIEAAQAVVLLADNEGRLLRTNAYLETVTGYGRETLLGAAWLDRLLAAADRPAALELFRHAGYLGVRSRAVFALQTRGNGPRVMAWAAQPCRDGRGLTTGVLAVCHDITELHDAQQKVVQLERLAAIGQTAAGLAHEGRNALQRGQACLERLKWRLQDQPEALALAERAAAAQDDLIRLYESVREFAAPIRLDPAPCDPAEVWRRSWEDVRDRAPGRDAELEEDLPPDGDRTCRADRFLLAQVFRNLFDNALGACHDPVRVRVACRYVQRTGRPALQIAVRDNGPGLTAEQRRKMFEPFFTTKSRGTGLGLAIVKRVVEAHGGEVALGADPGGAEIIFTLPREGA